MNVLVRAAEVEIVVQKSRFLSILIPADSQESARSTLKELKERYADASHVVHAFSVGVAASVVHGCSDDGEPSGTAGRPVLDVLKGSGGSNAFLAVVRWFGGTKLGTGGLVKAYQAAAHAAVQAATWEPWVDRELVRFRLSFAEHARFQAIADAFDVRIENVEYAAAVEVEASVVRDRRHAFEAKLRDLTNGRVFADEPIEDRSRG